MVLVYSHRRSSLYRHERKMLPRLPQARQSRLLPFFLERKRLLARPWSERLIIVCHYRDFLSQRLHIFRRCPTMCLLRQPERSLDHRTLCLLAHNREQEILATLFLQLFLVPLVLQQLRLLRSALASPELKMVLLKPGYQDSLLLSQLHLIEGARV